MDDHRNDRWLTNRRHSSVYASKILFLVFSLHNGVWKLLAHFGMQLFIHYN